MAYLPPADLVLCIDVLFHILEDNEQMAVLNRLNTLWRKYLAITAYERGGEPNERGYHLNIKKFDPTFFGKPIIREVIEEDGQLYFYLFEKNGSI
jgi:hypothetical protein